MELDQLARMIESGAPSDSRRIALSDLGRIDLTRHTALTFADAL
jgi:hypothetical protein